MQGNNPLKKNKSKTNLMQKFVDKFKKKKRTKDSKQASKEKVAADNSKGRKTSRSPSKSKGSGNEKEKNGEKEKGQVPKDMCEVTAKGIRKSKRDKRSRRERKKEKSEETQAAPAPSKAPSCAAIRPAESSMDVTVHNQKVEKAVKLWMEQLEKGDIRKQLDADFQPIDTIKVEADKCTAFRKYVNMCQSETLEVLDGNRVTNGEADFFYHGSVVAIPNITTKVVLAQLPFRDDPQCLEAFWLTIAAHRIQRVFVLLGADEMDKKTQGEIFPEDFVEYKTIRVNNRKTVPRCDDQHVTNDQLYYEVVPKDCAEAPFAMCEICDFWADARVPTAGQRVASTVASVFESDIDAEATIGVVSNFGAGRAGSFLVAAAAIEKLRIGEVPTMKETAMTVRQQRPGAVETFAQFIYTYVASLTWSLKYLMNAGLKTKVEKMIGVLETFAFERMAEEDEEDSVNE